jgi:hypothetical protein
MRSTASYFVSSGAGLGQLMCLRQVVIRVADLDGF